MSSEPVIRDYSESDLEAVLRCFHRSVHGIASRCYTDAQLSAWAPENPDRTMWIARLREGRTLLAEVDGALAGFVRAEESGYIDLMYVDPTFERRGVGRRLLTAACDWATARGASRLESEVSVAARALFEALGFRVETEQMVERRGVRFTNYRMACASAELNRPSAQA